MSEEPPYCDVCGQEGAALVCRDCYDANRITGETVARVPVLDLLALCGIQPSGVLAFDKDLEAIGKYIRGLRDLMTQLHTELDQVKMVAGIRPNPRYEKPE